MRKELKSKSRRKWLLGGSLAFASVALLTTGFATWVIGVHKPSGDGQVHIGVDTVEDKSVELTFKLDDTDDGIIVAEDAEKSSNDNLPIEKTVTPDWSIKIKDLNVVVGETLYNSLKAKKVDGQDLNLKIAFALQKDVAEEKDKNSVTGDIVGGRTGSSWKYIELATNEFNVTLPDSYPARGKICDIMIHLIILMDISQILILKEITKQFLSLGVLILMEKLLVNFTKEKSLQRACVNTIKKLRKSFKQ